MTWLRERGVEVNVVAGPATDNEVGVAYVRDGMELPAANARVDPERLTDIVEQATFQAVAS